MIRHGDVSASFMQSGYEGDDQSEIEITCTGRECSYSDRCGGESADTWDGEGAPCEYFPAKMAALDAMIVMLSEYAGDLKREHETGCPLWLQPNNPNGFPAHKQKAATENQP